MFSDKLIAAIASLSDQIAALAAERAKMHKAVEVLREVIDFACALNNVAAGQNPEQLDRWSAVLAALAAKVDASQAPNPAANGGRCQSDTITLPRAEVEALMEEARAFQMIRAVWTDPHNDDLMRKASMTLNALQERMK